MKRQKLAGFYKAFRAPLIQHIERSGKIAVAFGCAHSDFYKLPIDQKFFHILNRIVFFVGSHVIGLRQNLGDSTAIFGVSLRMRRLHVNLICFAKIYAAARQIGLVEKAGDLLSDRANDLQGHGLLTVKILGGVKVGHRLWAKHVERLPIAQTPRTH